MEEEILTRLQALAGPEEVSAPEYLERTRAAAAVAIEYAFEAIERGAEAVEAPPTLLAHARLSARSGVPLDTVLRRHFAGYTMLNNFLMQEAAAAGLNGRALETLLKGEAALFDRLVAALSEEYGREAKARARLSAAQRLADRVERLLAGEILETSHLSYTLDSHHIGLVCAGSGAEDAIRDLAAATNHSFLVVPRGEACTWAWLGGRRPLDRKKLAGQVEKLWPRHLRGALGESSRGVTGWRLTHHQAHAALPIALRGSKQVVCYSDVALLASSIRDDVLVRSLHDLYLAPLTRERDGGTVLRQTLRAYFEAQRNVSSAAAALGVSRRTVANRLQMIEERLDRPLGTCVASLEVALGLLDQGTLLGPTGDCSDVRSAIRG